MNKLILFLKKYKLWLLAGVAIAVALTLAFLLGGNVQEAAKQAEQTSAAAVTKATEPAKTAPTETAAATVSATETATAATQSTSPQKQQTATTAPAETVAATEMAPAATQAATSPPKQNNPSQNNGSQAKDQYRTTPVPAGKPKPVEPQEQEIKETELSCQFAISCQTILDHWDDLSEDIKELVPADGYLLPPTKVTFQEGESVFDVLQRLCRDNKIHLEFTNSPLYNTAYIEGIGNIYEFDCGANSGWMYRVNDWFPNYGCSRYALKDGDVVSWEYTCNLGYDIGGGGVSYRE